MKWHHGGIEVRSLETSSAFYENLFRFEVQECLVLDDEKIIFLNHGKVTLELIKGEENQLGPSDLHFAWEVEDLSGWREHLEESGLNPVDGPYHVDGGMTVIFYKGPDGEVIELVSRS
jgi:lactoylglutathione lyase